MKKARNKKLGEITTEDVIYTALGGAACLLANGAIDKVLDSVAPGQKEAAKKFVPIAKGALGGYLAMEGGDRRLKFAGLGMAGVAAVEVGMAFAPQYFTISGTDLYNVIGSADPMLLEIDPSVSSAPFVQEAVMSTEDRKFVTI